MFALIVAVLKMSVLLYISIAYDKFERGCSLSYV